MAYIIGTRKIYLFLTEEENGTSATSSDHSVESGEDITDHVKADAETITVTGQLVGSGYKSQIASIKAWEKSGQLCRYNGEMTLKNSLIKNFKVIHDNGCGTCSVSMEFQKIRIAQPAYVPADPATPAAEKATVNAGTQSVEVNNSDDSYHTVKAGDTIYALVNGAYKKYGKSCNDIMAANPDAFSRPGDFTTLKVGARLKMG